MQQAQPFHALEIVSALLQDIGPKAALLADPALAEDSIDLALNSIWILPFHLSMRLDKIDNTTVHIDPVASTTSPSWHAFHRDCDARLSAMAADFMFPQQLVRLPTVAIIVYGTSAILYAVAAQRTDKLHISLLPHVDKWAPVHTWTLRGALHMPLINSHEITGLQKCLATLFLPDADPRPTFSTPQINHSTDWPLRHRCIQCNRFISTEHYFQQRFNAYACENCIVEIQVREDFEARLNEQYS